MAPVNNSPRQHWKNIQAFWCYVNRLLKETRPQTELGQSVITEEWWKEVHADSESFSFTLPPNMQALYLAIYECSKYKRTASLAEMSEYGKEGQKTWECDMRLRILNFFFYSLLAEELQNFATTVPNIKSYLKHRHLCEGWTMKFLKVT